MGPEPRTYRIVTGGETVDLFRTAEIPGVASADELAVDNLADYTVHHLGTYTLLYVEGDASAPIAEALAGVPHPLVPPDDIASDACHCGPRVVAPAAAAEPAAASRAV